MSQPLRILIVDDSDDDASLLQYTLRHGGFEVSCAVVETPAAMRSALENQNWDVITSDHAMPHFSATAALKLAKELRPDLPFIIVSGEIDLNLAVSLMRGGAKDYIQKRELVRLVPVIERELSESELRRGRRQAETALLISETRYRRLFETAQDGILILDANTGQVTDVNPFLISMLGYSKEEFLGKELWELGAFKDVETSKQAYLELQSHGYIRYDNLPLEAKDGRHVAVEFVSSVYLVDHTRIAQCNIRDITERELALLEINQFNAELEQRVRDRTAQLETVNKELEAFNYSVSHDLRAPLRRVIGFTEALKEDDCNKQSADSLRLIQRIRDSVSRMNALIDALLELARFSRVELARHAVNMSATVQTIAAELQQNDPARQVEFTIGESILAFGDDQLLRIVLENLIGNAWKFTAKQANAQIEFGMTPQVDGSAAYFVRDNGAGFDMGYAHKLFGAFQRLHSEKEFPGIGIGLATVQRIIHRHSGRVWAEGVVDQGAAFYFTLAGA
jgi:PAS domain S-box-containing protein